MQKLKEPILVTGAAGFIGRRMVERFLKEGKKVVALDLIPCPEALSDNPLLDWRQGDITDPGLVDEAVAGSACVFHLAAMVGDWGNEALHQLVTVEGTRNVFKSVERHGAKQRIVLASSIVVYGHQIDGNICHESMLHGDSLGPYSNCKQAQERLAQTYLQRGLDIRIVRPANVYGAGSKPWVEELCIELKRGVPALIGGGDYNAGLAHVENVIEVMVRSARVASARGQIFNAADDEGITWKQYMGDLAKACGAPLPKSIPRLMANYMAVVGETTFRFLNMSRRPPLTREALNLVGSEHLIDMTKAKDELGYKPQKSYEQGISEIRQYLSSEV